MARIVNKEERLNNPLEDLISFPDPITDKEKSEREKALGQQPKDEK